MIEFIKNRIVGLLQSSQKHTNTDMVYLAKHGASLSTAQIFASVGSFLIALALGNFLMPEQYGSYQYVLSILGTLALFSLSGMESAIIGAVAKNHEGTLNEALKIKLKWGFFILLTCLGLSIYYWANNNLIFTYAFFVAGIFSPIANASMVYNAYLSGKKEFGIYAKYRMLTTIFTTLCIIITAYYLKNIPILITVYFLSLALANIFFYIKTISVFKPNDTIDASAISFGKHLSFMKVFSFISMYLDKIIIYNFIGPVQLAIYYFALAIPDQVRALARNIHSIALPKFAQSSSYDIKKSLPKKLWIFTGIMVLVIIGYILVAPFFFKLFFPKYLNSIIFSLVISISMLDAVTYPISAALTAKKKQKELYQSSILIPAISIIAQLILIPLYGLWGAVIALIIGRFSTIIIMLWQFQKIDR